MATFNVDSSPDSHSENGFQYLDKQKINIGLNGEVKLVNALHKGWADNRTFPSYFPPPISVSGIADLSTDLELELHTKREIWKESAQLYIDNLEFLLTIPSYRFWSQMIYHKGVHTALLSYLTHAPRPFNFNTEDVSEEIENVQLKIHRLVFMVFLRMATHKESNECQITPSVFGNLIYDSYLFDIPKVLDLCAIYGNQNKELMKKMVENIFHNQKYYLNDLKVSVDFMTKALSTILENLELNQDDVEKPKVSKTKNIGSVSSSKLKDVILYTLDTFGTIYSFLEIYPDASRIFFDAGFPTKLTSTYDSVVGNVFSELNFRIRKGDFDMEILKSKLNITRTFMLKIFRLIEETCFIQPVLTQSHSHKSDAFESFLIVRSDILSEKKFILDYETLHPFNDDLDVFLQSNVKSDKERIDYIVNGIQSIKLEVPDCKSLKSETKPSKGIKNAKVQDFVKQTDFAALGATAAVDTVTGPQLDSLITQVKDLFNDFGEGFIQICLEYYNYDAEKVINAILENSLPASLIELDSKMERLDDVLNSNPSIEEAEVPTLLSQRRNVFDNDEFDVFNRDDVNFANIHKGKWHNPEQLNNKEMKELTLKLVDDFSNAESVNLYDDEYDDTYDVQSIAANESATIDELLARRPFGIPRVLGGRNEAYESNEEKSEDEGEEPPVMPRDEFVQNPAELREKAEQRRQQRTYTNTRYKQRDVKGAPRGQGQSDTVLKNRASKEKNKTYVGNHNRRAMADRKRSKGMFPT